jgi:UDP-N-acetylglucosamine acyltransferase
MSARKSSQGAERPITVHPTAQVGAGARLEPGVVVGPYAVIAGDVTIGSGTRIGPHVVIEDGVRIGRDNEISAAAVIGCAPQDRGFLGEETFVIIGDRNRIREYASITRASGAGQATIIGNDTFIMAYVRVDHNCRVGDRVVIVTHAGLGGHVELGDDAYVGGLAGVHQFVHVGRLAMIAGYSFVRQDCPPFMLVAGQPGRCRGLNLVGLRRNGLSPKERAVLRRAFHILYQSRLEMTSAVATLAAELGEHPLVQELITFLQASRKRKRGVVRWMREEP